MNLPSNRTRVLDYIREHLGQHGISPSLGEIARAVGIEKPAVHFHLTRLEQAGEIARMPSVPRSIRLPEMLDNHATADLLRALSRRGYIIRMDGGAIDLSGPIPVE